MSMGPRLAIPTGRRLPPGERIYAIGDVHGQVDLLDALLAKIDEIENILPAARTKEIFLGDYVDRGTASAAVLERLSAPTTSTRQRICLGGNHEALMRAFLRHPAAYDDWRSIGGRDTLASYGLPRRLLQEREGILRTWREFNLVIPAHHRAFIEDLPVLHRAGDYVFVHAGIRPGKPVEEQVVQDLLWIRTEFLSCEDDYGFVVVHGHTPSRQVEFRTNRIGVDTGAYATRILSCILLQDDRAVVIQARPDFVGPVEPNLMAIG